jgi:hypothetical protein
VSDEPDNMVLTLLRAIRGDIADIRLDVRELKERVTNLETLVGNSVSTELHHYASLSGRLDRIGGDVERIKTRLDIVDAPATP